MTVKLSHQEALVQIADDKRLSKGSRQWLLTAADLINRLEGDNSMYRSALREIRGAPAGFSVMVDMRLIAHKALEANDALVAHEALGLPTCMWCTVCDRTSHDCRCLQVPRGQWIKIPVIPPGADLWSVLQATGLEVHEGYGQEDEEGTWQIHIAGGHRGYGDEHVFVVMRPRAGAYDG